MLFKPDIWNRSIKVSVAVTVCLFLLIWLSPPQRDTGRRFKSWLGSPSSQSDPGRHHGHEKPVEFDECLRLPSGNDVVITVKTGASEAVARIPTQLATSLRCATNVLLFSDMEQTLGNYTLHDALATIPEFVKAGNRDFDLYRQQQARKSLGWKDVPTTEETKTAAWNLDKYKNLHVIAKSWWLLPKKKWYLHIDADTYLVWPSLLWWLDRLNTTEALYTGSLTCFAEIKAAHGGSGILLNELATQAMVVDNRSTIPTWDAEAHSHCCGDELVARALNDNGIKLHNSWPIIQGENPFTIQFGPSSWCEPVVTMHHVSTGQMEMLDRFERRRVNRDDPLTYAELFTDFVADAIPERLDDWNNMSDDITIPNCPSFNECIRVCNENEKCFQSLFDGSDCLLGTKHFRLGEQKKPEDGKKWQSQWNKERMLKWASEHTDCSNLSLAFHDAFVCGNRPDK